ncbi:4Fe-4S binding protein [Desulfosporosinus lacus]|uniref:4Fe-4S binding domain-containing protein n=1 Tax=Desulfosporosinus lacus DSM 15449 TaxID=1121420 RepID=A0A1M5QTZ6_9FIRM|nr:4Fe-4S binding protein [Desulfosporosinus lacus]SHH17189.1 4Fe-4S binding domain-containing protein [Desulfosporosinus lacus DSM 15449]
MSQPLQPKSPLKKNFLNFKPLKWFLQSSLYPSIFQWAAVLVFAVIMVQTLAGPTSAHDNFGTAATWVLWWPLLPLFFFLFGRFWCGVCPFGLVSDLTQKVFGANRKVPNFLRKYGLWIIDITFIFITWSDHVWGIVESPRGSGTLLLLILGGVMITAMFFERRTWCRYLCFLGSLSGNYSRAGMLELRADKEICKTCTTRDCYKGNSKTAGCPMFEFPMAMENNANCNLCGNCIKSCPHDSIRISPRKPTSEFWSMTRAHFEESFLAIVIVGIVFVQNITMLEFYQSYLKWAELTLGIANKDIAFTIIFIIAMTTPVLLLFAATAVSKRYTGETIRTAFARFGYAVIPLDLASHMAHNLFHLLAEGKSIYYTFMGLFGVHIEGPADFVSDPTIQIMQYVLVIAGTLGSLYTAYRIAKTNYGAKKALSVAMPYLVIISIFGVLNFLTFVVRMSMRM